MRVGRDATGIVCADFVGGGIDSEPGVGAADLPDTEEEAGDGVVCGMPDSALRCSPFSWFILTFRT